MLIGLGGGIAYSQKNLSGNLNQPKSHVVTVGADRVTVDDITGFYANDTILLIQMQGVRILTDPGTYGSPDSYYGEPGAHEFLIIQSVNAGTKEIIFRNNIINAYDPLGNVQIIRAPYYHSVDITGKLYCDPWDSVSSTGGVMVLMVGRKLTLSADIDVSGLGFAGGKDTIGDGICVMTDQANLDKEYFPSGFTNAGYKGEGAANFTAAGLPLSPGFMKSKGSDWNGGGGGNGRYSGGGGGANGGKGGAGGKEDGTVCGIPLDGGREGYQAVWAPTLVDRIFLGGGGGASTRSASGSSSFGGKGGGVVIIVADTIEGNGGRIVSNGSAGGTATGVSGSGGGGAGGSVALYVRNYGSNPFKIAAAGGNGGDNPGGYGEGGGGGGGLVYLNIDLPANVTDSISGGLAGNYSGPNANVDGALGEKRLNFKANLNGFLFNTIESSVTGNQVDSICSGTTPPKIMGTQPLGGTTPYTFVWEKSYDAAFTAPTTLTNDPDPVNYTPSSVETATVWFRRIITDNTVPTAIVDVSKPVMIIVQSQIQNNVIVANPDTICMNTDPAIITQATPDLVYPSQYLRFVWQSSTDSVTWSSPLAPSATKEYDPNPSGGLAENTWYRRTVVSGRCVDNSAVVKFTVLNDLGSNGFSKLYDTICFGGNTDLATLAGPTGGNPADYRYIWQQSATGQTGSWSSIAGATQKDYDPDASVSLPAGDHFYRRIVLSGEQDACKDTSGAAARKVWPVITGNLIQADQTIGYDSIPLKLTQSVVPAGGAGLSTFKYSWVQDTAGFPGAPGPGLTNHNEYQPPDLRWTTSFRRVINSSACTDTSNSVMITVDAAILNSISLNNSSLDTIYTGQTSSAIDGSVPAGGSASPSDGYSVSWYQSTKESPGVSDWSPVTGSDLQYSPGILTTSTWFRRDISSPEINPRATVSSNLLRVIVLPALVNVEISTGQSICSGTRPLRINGDNMLAGGDGKYTFTWQDSTSLHGWQDIPGYIKIDSANYKPGVLTSSSAYRRIVYSGKNDCGEATSNQVIVTVNPMPGIPDAGPDRTVYSINKTILMDAVPPLTGETGEWTVIGAGGAIIAAPDKYNSEIRNLTQGKNDFLWTVTTDAGQCSLSDTVSVFLNKDFIPRAFSPNGDGINDKFIIEGVNLSENIKVELKILNGAGSVVFATSNSNGDTWSDWDGKDTRGKDLPEGTYYYLFKMTSGDRVDMKTGFIILKRN